MNIEILRTYCLSKKGTNESFPFDQSTLVFKVLNKMFLLVNVDSFDSFNVKCDPEIAIELREKYDAVLPGYHMNKKHWNTVVLNGSIPNQELLKWIDWSYDLVYNSLSKKEKELLS